MLLEFENKTNVKITGFYLMHFGFTLGSSDIALGNIDLLNAHLDLSDTYNSSKHFVCLQKVLQTSSGHVFKLSSRHLEDVFSVTIFRFPRRRLARCLQDVFKTSLQDVLRRSWKAKNFYTEDVLKTSSRHVLKTSWRPTNVCWVNFKAKITDQTGHNGKIDVVKIFARLKYLRNFLITLAIPLINCEVNLILTWSANYVIIYTNVVNQNPTFVITERKPYVPVVTLSTQENTKLLQ